VVDERGRELPERWEGRLEFQGPSATGGYFRNPEATRRLFHGEWLDSGDRAYLAEGDVYLTGRVKDVIIRGGRNFYPYELEEAVGKIPGVRKGCVAALAGADARAGTERLVVVAETRQTAAEALEGLRRGVQAATVELLGTPADDIALVPPHTVLKTSSGKIRRAAIRERYERRTLGKEPRALWRQLASLAFTSAIAQARRGLLHGGDILYAVYAWTVFAALAPAVWIAVVAAPRRSWRWAVVHRVARLLARLTGTPLSVSGLEHLPVGPFVLTANHTSYLDALVLAAALPVGFSYVAKQELRRRAVVGLPLKRLGTLFVDRFDIQRGVDEVNNIVQSIEAGHSPAFFPEGTFQLKPGLRPFRMGAFVVAAQTGIPVVPVAIRGPRFILRAGSWRPRRGAVRVLIEAPILPQGNDWRAAVKLRDEVRATILRHCGESDLPSP
jgi:1-acyl-sn-glycerol-3-phosphate acyltransferase